MHVSTIIGQKGNGVFTVEPGKKMSDMTTILAEHKIGAVIVTDENAHVCGVLSERDIVRALSKDGPSALTRPVSEYMTADVITCKMDDTIEYLMELMTSRRIRHLPVVEDMRLNGIVSIGDVVKCRIAEAEAEADALKAYIATG